MSQKGKISTIENGGKAVTVTPYKGETVTAKLTVPFFLYQCLEVDMPVVYASFDDNTGVVLARMDGEWNHKLDGEVEVVEKITAKDLKTVSVVSYNSHTHTTKDGSTSGPT